MRSSAELELLVRLSNALGAEVSTHVYNKLRKLRKMPKPVRNEKEENVIMNALSNEGMLVWPIVNECLEELSE